MIRTESLFDLSRSLAGGYLSRYEYPWQAVSGIKDFIVELGVNLNKSEYSEIMPCVWVHKTAYFSSSACILSPTVICAESEIRHCAFIRGSALIGRNCVIGNSTELKNVILFDGVQVPHYNYVGDSILGYKSHMGAGSITSNVKSDKSFITVNTDENKIETGLKKFGAIIGDNVEIGCNSVLNPGTVIGKNTNIYPMLCLRGVIASDSIYKSSDVIVPKENR